MNGWQCRPVSFKFQLSDWTIGSVSIPLQVRAERLTDETPSVDTPQPPTDELLEGSQGFLIRGLPIASRLATIHRTDDYVRYIPLQYQHCYIDLSLSFENYQKKFSSKTRATINRKIRRFTERCGGEIRWKTYKMRSEMRDFIVLARAVSKLTYQERLLDAGIPDSDDFVRQAESLAASDLVRAYILFDGERPVSYLYCPAQDGVLIYSYQGYDPDYMQLSVGTVLQWLAVEQLFNERRFRYFDFTEGDSEHKRLFGTHQRQCANVFWLKATFRNMIAVYAQLFMNRFSKRLGEILARLGVKTKIKSFLRLAG